MKEFFKDLLKRLKPLCGLNQYLTMLESATGKEEIVALLDVLCRVADQFPMIPDADKQKIIENGVIHDAEFTGLNARVIARWLNQHKDRYTTMQAKVESEVSTGKVLTPDEYAPYLEQWLEQVKKIGNQDVTQEQRIENRRKQFFGKEIEGPAFHPSTTIEQYEERELELEAAKSARLAELREKHPTLTIEELNRLL
jgi:hypothetical protein